jgi:hypothetical protein
MTDAPQNTLSRRAAMIAGAVGLAAVPLANARAASDDPRRSATGQIKMGAALDGSPAFWLYSGLIYAVQPGRHPTAILAATRCQSSWVAPQADGSALLSGATLTYFQDLQTGKILDAFDNPLSGRRNSVTANFLSGASLLYPADGTSARAMLMPVNGGVIAPGGYNDPDKQKPIGLVRWELSPDTVTLLTDSSWPVPVQPQLETRTQSCARSDFFDPAIKRMLARYAGTTIIPWMQWMEMGATPGHLVWHTSGEKYFSLDALDADYRARAGALLDKFEQNPFAKKS